MENENIEILIRMNEISEQIENALEYYIPILDEIAKKSEKCTLVQAIKSDIQAFKFILYDRYGTFKQFKQKFENDLKEICQHDWIIDYIDNSEYECRKIMYCKKCNSTKRE
jgi:hypothetical protein